MKRIGIGVLFFVLCFSAFHPTYEVQAKTVNQLKNEKSKYEQNKKNAKAALEQAKKNQASITEEIAQLDQNVSQAEAELDEVEEKLSATQTKLNNAEAELKVATEKKEEQVVAFKKRIKYIHENGSIGYLQVILEANSFGDLLTRMQYVNDIMNYDKATLEELKKNQKIIEEKTIEIKTERDKIAVLVEEQKKKSEELQLKLKEKKAAAEKYRTDIAKYEQEVASWTKASNEVESLINQATAKSRSGGAAQGNVNYTGGKFAWPVPGRSYISSGYGYRSRPIGKGQEFHTGYDIPGAYGTNIVAAESGTVIAARYVNGYGYTVMIDHGGGLVTLYGHNSKLVVSAGEKVSRGQTIAKCGSTGNSTGNHCHFEVRLNGKHTSPKPYLGV
ncbi:MAG: peptidoglycan DD-metalloendopeptidase family protein [Epulopiscium sp.]|nr:peptidoglycan DD-metalloendopeptidase family protein [Candidatus Epulonipiscium sp.]